MEALLEEHERLVETANLSNSLHDVQNAIDILCKARDVITASQSTSTVPSVMKLPTT